MAETTHETAGSTHSTRKLAEAVRPVLTAPGHVPGSSEAAVEAGLESLRWRGNGPERNFSIGIEEEAMLLEPDTGRIAHRSEDALRRLRGEFGERIGAETHDSAIEISTDVHRSVAEAAAELRELRGRVKAELEQLELRAAVAGTHPSVIWHEIEISPEKRYEKIHDAMRELARREPTFALHLHIGIADPEDAIRLYDRMRVHLPLLLALSGNSPFWQGRDSGLASARIPLFQAFPRVGIPRAFGDYESYAGAIGPLLESGAIPDATYLWWDIRPSPALGTIEIRIMDGQTTISDSAALVALTISLAKLELERGHAGPEAIAAQEVIAENRFRAARDGVEAELIDLSDGSRRGVRELAEELLAECAGPAAELGCEDELEGVGRLLEEPPATRQRRAAGSPPDLGRLLETMAAAYAD